LAVQGQYFQTRKPARFCFTLTLLRIAGYGTKIFCFCCVAWQFQVCLEKYLSEPVSSHVAFIPNNGRYPGAITFCKKINYINITSYSELLDETIDVVIEAEFLHSSQGWVLIYKGKPLTSILPYRKFTTFSWSENTFKLCFSVQLGSESQRLSQLMVKYKWINDNYEILTNLQIFVHSWGSFGAVKYEIPLSDDDRIIKLSQETMESLSTRTLKCSSYENSFLDKCFEREAIKYTNATLGCISDLLR
jgi:hypothetical protein